MGHIIKRRDFPPFFQKLGERFKKKKKDDLFDLLKPVIEKIQMCYNLLSRM